MKTLVLTTALALGITAPAFAQSQLAASLGVDAGTYSVSQLAILKDHSTQTSNDGRVYFGNFSNNERFSTRGVHNARAAAHFAEARKMSNQNSVTD